MMPRGNEETNLIFSKVNFFMPLNRSKRIPINFTYCCTRLFSSLLFPLASDFSRESWRKKLSCPHLLINNMSFIFDIKHCDFVFAILWLLPYQKVIILLRKYKKNEEKVHRHCFFSSIGCFINARVITHFHTSSKKITLAFI